MNKSLVPRLRIVHRKKLNLGSLQAPARFPEVIDRTPTGFFGSHDSHRELSRSLFFLLSAKIAHLASRSISRTSWTPALGPTSRRQITRDIPDAVREAPSRRAGRGVRGGSVV